MGYSSRSTGLPWSQDAAVVREEADIVSNEVEDPDETLLASSTHAFNNSRKSNQRVFELAMPWATLIAFALIAACSSNVFSPTSDSLAEPAKEDLHLFSLAPFSDRDLQATEGIHHHKPIYDEEHSPLFPLDRSDIHGFVLAVLGLMIAAGGGIGGGGILVPIFILVMGFSPKHAIPLSNISVFGGAMANTILNVRKRHPLADRPLVDWDLILVMEPLTIAGALIGAFLNKVLPELLLTVLLVALLSFTANNSLRKAVKMYKKETELLKLETGLRSDGTRESELTRMAKEGEEDDDDGAEDGLLDHMEKKDGDDEDVPPMTEVQLQDSKLKEELDQLLTEEREVPSANLMILIAMFVVVLTINLLKGGGAFPSPLGIKCGSRGFWMANFAMLGWIVLISLFVRQYLLRKYESKKKCHYQYVEGDIEWDERATIVYPGVCCFAGFFAGMFGVGGGIVKGPLMLAMGVHPAVSSASSACMILFTSFTATTSFVVFGLLVPDYAAACVTVGFFATLAGQLGLSYIMKKAQRNSYIVFSIGGVVLISAFLMTIQSLLSMASGEKHHSGGICGKGD